jgi:methylglutaconyl-CoA hydratase
MSQGQVSDFLDSLRCLVSELETVKIPSVGIVDGYALGGGTEIALGCDLRVGGELSLMDDRTIFVEMDKRLMNRSRNNHVTS